MLRNLTHQSAVDWYARSAGLLATQLQSTEAALQCCRRTGVVSDGIRTTGVVAVTSCGTSKAGNTYAYSAALSKQPVGLLLSPR